MSEPVLHVDLIALRPGVTPEIREALLPVAAGLTEIDGVVQAGVIDLTEAAAFDLAFCFVLDEFAALEPFGTEERYVRFLQGSVAPLLKELAGADVRLDRPFPPAASEPASATFLAVEAPEQTYDWEIRERLASWTDRPRAQPTDLRPATASVFAASP
jgi:hypothetical protein